MWPQTRPGDVRFSVPVGEAPESPRRVDAIVGQPLPSLRPRSSGGARPQGRQPAWWTRRSTMATTATGSPKISAQALKVLFELTMSDRRSCRELTRARKSAAVSGSSANPLVAEGSTPERRRRTAHGDGGARATGRDVAGEARAGGSGPELPGDRAGRTGRRPDPTAHRSRRSRSSCPPSWRPAVSALMARTPPPERELSATDARGPAGPIASEEKSAAAALASGPIYEAGPKQEAHFVLQMAFPGPAPRVLGDQPSKPSSPAGGGVRGDFAARTRTGSSRSPRNQPRPPPPAGLESHFLPHRIGIRSSTERRQ
jgi:hypothetical protein